MLAPAPASLAPSPWARANVHGRKLGASHSGAELSAVDLGAELGAVDLDAELGALPFNPGLTFLPERSSPSFSSLSGFFSPHFTLPHESAYWTLETLI